MIYIAGILLTISPLLSFLFLWFHDFKTVNMHGKESFNSLPLIYGAFIFLSCMITEDWTVSFAVNLLGMSILGFEVNPLILLHGASWNLDKNGRLHVGRRNFD